LQGLKIQGENIDK